jgi:hypothetical protein
MPFHICGDEIAAFCASLPWLVFGWRWVKARFGQ